MRPPAYQALVEKSRAACVAAVETYNRASAPYREENFAVLMINAWELLLKARVIKENGGKVSSVYAREHIKRRNGKYGKRAKVRLTRYGSPHTIGVVEAGNLVAAYKSDKLALLWQKFSQGYAELNHLRQCGQREGRARVM
jgi:Protein of unknown function (DUF3644)